LKFKKSYFIFFLFSISVFAKAQNDSLAITKARIDKHYIKSYFLDCRDVAISPFYWNKNKLFIASGAAVVSAFCFTQDEAIQKIISKNQNQSLLNISKYGIEPFGRGLYSLPAMGFLYLYGALNKDEKSKKVAMLGTKAFVVSGLTAGVIKYSFHRHRPDDELPIESSHFDGPSFKQKHLSFVSGHTITIFSIASVVATEYKDKKAIPVIAYSIAGLTAISRIYDNKHWASDALIGAVLGYGIGKLICRKNNWKIKIN